jgi:hypothetical protein
LKITKRLLTASLLFLLFAPALPLQAQDMPPAEKQKIEFLIKHLEDLKDASFVRNGSDYDSKTAAKFLRGKWNREGKQIKTAVDFIDKVANVSSTSGKPYLIRFKHGREVKCGEYLKNELEKLEQTRR